MNASASPFSGRVAVLVVEDDPISRDLLLLMLRSAEVEAEAAEDGQAATELIAARGPEAFPVVFTDAQMPRLDGLGLLSWLNDRAPATATVVMTASQERELVSASLRGGAVEFLDKPFDLRSVLRVLHAATDTHRRRASRLAADRRLADVADIGARLTRPAARALARHPAAPVLETRFYPVSEAGGDFVKAARLEDDRVLLVLGDVSGHGLKEGFVSAYFQGIVEGMALRGAPAEAIADTFNRFLAEDWNDEEGLVVGTSLSACLLELDFRGGRVSSLNFGSPAARLVDAGGGVRELAPGGSPLGWFAETAPARDAEALGERGQLWLWSDGLEEHAVRMGVPPLALAHRILGEPAGSLGETLLAGAADDILVCRLRWTGGVDGRDAWLPIHEEVLAGDAASGIDGLHAGWVRVLRLVFAGIGEDGLAHDVPLCLREAVLNALDHGCRHDPERRVRVEMRLDPAARHLLARVTDDGDGFDPAAPEPGKDPDHISLGLQLIRSLTQACGHENGGRTLFMLFALPPVA